MLFYKCKVNINEFLYHDNFDKIKMEIIPNTFLVASNENEERYTYKRKKNGIKEQHLFTNIEKVSDNIIVGVYRKLGEETLMSYQYQGTEEEVVVDNVQKVKCLFIYLIEEELLYLEVTKESKKYLKQVLKNLADYLFYLNNYVADKMGRIEILPIADINTFQEQFKKRKNIKSIEVYFIAPNKRKMDFHEVMEETSKLPNIHSGITTLRTRDNWDGEQLLDKNEFIQSAVEHASCGYAKITVNKRRKNELSTENKTIEKSLDEIIKNGDNIIEKIKNLKE